MPVTVTETAAREIDAIIRQQGLDADKVRLRVGVKGGGCSGFSYLLDLTEVQKETDELWEFSYARRPDPKAAEAAGQGGVATASADTFTVRVICDPKSLLYIYGMQLDFSSALIGGGFNFTNPNATQTCGCGSSFAV